METQKKIDIMSSYLHILCSLHWQVTYFYTFVSHMFFCGSQKQKTPQHFWKFFSGKIKKLGNTGARIITCHLTNLLGNGLRPPLWNARSFFFGKLPIKRKGPLERGAVTCFPGNPMTTELKKIIMIILSKSKKNTNPKLIRCVRISSWWYFLLSYFF